MRRKKKKRSQDQVKLLTSAVVSPAAPRGVGGGRGRHRGHLREMILHHYCIKNTKKVYQKKKKKTIKKTGWTKVPSLKKQLRRTLWRGGSGRIVLVQVGLGGTISSHSVHRRRVGPGSAAVCGGSSMTAPQKGAPEGRGLQGRISSTRCVSSMLICHPLNLYCSSAGSVSHIAKNFGPGRPAEAVGGPGC